MTGAGEPAAGRYSAFISYSHRDTAFARRLHRRLEDYRLPAKLSRGRPGDGPRPGRLDPVFRDRDEMAAAPDLTEVVREAIERSRRLIVICTPNSAASDWVGREIRLFRQVHGDAGVLTAIFKGSSKQVFHPALLEPGPDGRKISPLAADFRPEGDGDRLALLKLIAALADASLDDLVQRDAQRQVRNVLLTSLASVLGFTAVGALALAVIQARITSQREHAAGDKVVTAVGGDLYTRLKRFGALRLRDDLNRGALGFYSGKDTRQLAPGDVIERAKLLQQSGGDDITRGDFAAADAQLRDAWTSTARLLRAAPNDTRRIFAHAQSEYWLGYLRASEGRDDDAEARMKGYAALAARLVTIDSANADWRLERGYSESNLGVFLLRRSIDTPRAGALFRAAQADFETVGRLRPTDRKIQIQVEDGHGWLATVRRFSGDEAGALTERLAQRRIIERLLADDPRDYQARLRIVSSDLALGRISAALGATAEASARFEKARAGALALAREDPENLVAARQARGSQLFEARAWLMSPPGFRPPRSRIAAMLGNCAADAARPKNEEVTELCELLHARFLAESGDRAAAKRLVETLLAGPLAHGERLSAFWLMDLGGEARRILASTSGAQRPGGQNKGEGL